MKKPLLVRITTVPMALAYPLRGQPSFMHTNGFDVLMISADGAELGTLLRNERVPHRIVRMTRSITPFADLRSIASLAKLFKEIRPDVVHSETPKAGLVAMLAAKRARVPVRIHTVAGMPLMVEKGIKRFILKLVEKITYRAATEVWPNGPSLYDFILREKMAPIKKLHVIGEGSSNGIDTARFDPASLKPEIMERIKEEIEYNHELTYLLFTGRLVFDKGVAELVRVFVKLHKEMPDLRLLLCGVHEPDLDPLPADAESAIIAHPAIKHIPWTNFAEYYKGLADFFVFPSYREGFPNVLLEAGAMGLPVICSRIGGNIDIVHEPDTGFIFEPQDEQSLENKLRAALLQREDASRRAANLQRFVREKFDVRGFQNEMLNRYRTLLHIKSSA